MAFLNDVFCVFVFWR